MEGISMLAIIHILHLPNLSKIHLHERNYCRTIVVSNLVLPLFILLYALFRFIKNVFHWEVQETSD